MSVFNKVLEVLIPDRDALDRILHTLEFYVEITFVTGIL